MFLKIIRCSKDAILAFALLSSLAFPALAQCKLYGGIGTAISEDMAKFMADAAVKNIIENKGLKPKGKITHKCKPSGVLFECAARQQGC
ncbi:MAG: hypothetical protein ACKOW3_09555 [Hyphomicrobium sp.]